RQIRRRHHHLGARAGHFRCDDHHVPDLRAARAGAALATDKGETAAMAVQALREIIRKRPLRPISAKRGEPVMLTDRMLRRVVPAISAAATFIAIAAASTAAMAQEAQEQYFGI